jgi:molybdate transport system ATP-binding protein
MREIIRINGGMTRMPEWRLKKPVEFNLLEGEHIAIVGDNGSGKTKLADMITGKHPVFPDQIAYDFGDDGSRLVSDNIKYITFRDSYGSYDGSYYLQQRWNQQEIDEETPTAGRLLEEAYHYSAEDTAERRAFQKHLYEIFSMEHLLDKYIVLLSSGEMRKFQLAKMLMSNPKILIMDNPFIGLDEETREQLEGLLRTLAEEKRLQIILVVTKTRDIPDFITHVWEMQDEQLLPKQTRDEYLSKERSEVALEPEKAHAITTLPQKDNDYNAEKVAVMDNVSISYGTRTILDKVNWTVFNGDHWALSGKNGAGKSTLLSLVCADNPQSYACDITLFDKKRGSGETIWDIKKHIGYVSPEMHRAYNKDIECIKIVASGLNDSVGLYVKPDEKDHETCRFWMRIFGVEDLQNRTFLKVSSGEQRLVLLARAFVKDPELLILDEPLHGLDEKNGQKVKDIIGVFCKRKNKTLVMVSHYRDEYPTCIDKEIILKRNI